MFKCQRINGNLMLSEGSCANQFKMAQTKEWRERLPHCADCPVGANNAGMGVSAAHHKEVCIRCGSNHGRLLLSHRLCIYCYNREREWRIGKNSKGTFPLKYIPLIRFLLVCVSSGRRYIVYAYSVVEARLSLQRELGLYNLIPDTRHSPLSRQKTIFEIC